jgi:hypothetical protein
VKVPKLYQTKQEESLQPKKNVFSPLWEDENETSIAEKRIPVELHLIGVSTE